MTDYSKIDYIKLLEDLRKECCLEHTVFKFLEKLCAADRHFWFVNDADNFKVKTGQSCACGKKKAELAKLNDF